MGFKVSGSGNRFQHQRAAAVIGNGNGRSEPDRSRSNGRTNKVRAVTPVRAQFRAGSGGGKRAVHVHRITWRNITN